MNTYSPRQFFFFFAQFKDGFNALQKCCIHITLKRSEVSLTEMVTFAQLVNAY